MAVNRFYSPTRGQYISGYIPQRVPVELMLAKAQQADKVQEARLAELNKDKEWTMDALPNYDTEYVEKEKQHFREFTDSMINQDLTNQVNYQKYLDFVRSFTDDPNKKLVKQAYDTHQQYKENRQKVESGNATEWEKDYVDSYEKYYNLYTKETAKGGLGFAGDYKIFNPNIQKGVDRQKAREELFDHLRADGGENAVRDASGIYYKSGWEALGKTKIGQAAIKQFDTYYTSAAGRQDQVKYDVAWANSNDPTMPFEEQYKKLSDDEKKAYNEAKQKAVFEDVLKTGETFQFGKSSSTLHEAKNAAREERKTATVDTPLVVPGLTVAEDRNDWKTDREFKKNATKTIEALNSDISFLGDFQRQMAAGRVDLSKLSNDQLNKLAGAIDPDNTRLAGEIKAGNFSNEQLNQIINNKQGQIENIKMHENAINDNIKNAMNSKFGNKYNGRTYSEIIASENNIINKIGQSTSSDIINAVKNNDTRVLNKYKTYGNKDIQDFLSLTEAKQDSERMMNSPFFINDYNKGKKSYQPQAVVRNPNDKYTGYVYNTDGSYEIHKDLSTAEKKLEEKIAANPSIATFTINGETVKPFGGTAKDPSVEILSTDIPKDGKKGKTVTMNVRIKTDKVQKIKSGVDSDGNPTYKYQPIYKEAKMTVPNTNYSELKSMEYEAGINPEDVTDIKWDGNKKYFKLDPTTSNKASIKNFELLTYENHPDLVSDFKKFDAMNDGDRQTLNWEIKDNFGRTKATKKVNVMKTTDPNSPNRYYIGLGDSKEPIEVANEDQLKIMLMNYKNELQFAE